SGATNSCSRTDVLASEKVHLTYDNLGRVKYKNFTNTATADIDYYYDPNGNVTNVNSGPTQWSYKYNTQGQTTDETLKLDGQTFELKYGYDSLGNQSTLTYPSGRQISYAPNALGQPTKAGEFATGAIYHANGTLIDFTYGNGLKYNLTLNIRQLPEHLKTLKGSTSLTHLQYTYDGNGNTSNITDHKDASYTIAMGYDGLDRLTSANGKWGAASFAYDTMGNITSKNLGSMAVSYVYDPTTKRLNSASVTGSKSKSYSFTYDTRGAVTNTGSVLLPRNQAGQVTGSGGHTYVYDGNGKRVKDIKNNATTKARYSIYDKSGRMIYQWDQQTETITDYIFLGKELVTEAQVSLGDGSLSVDNTNVGYTGHQWDDDSGLNYMQARYYDPLLGRFLSNDPVGFRDTHSFNRYTYVNNNPYKYTDPDGKFAILLWLGTPAGIAALQYTGTALVGIIAGVAIVENRKRDPKFGQKVKDKNKNKNNGDLTCDGCGVEVQEGKKREKGVGVPDDEGQADHVIPLADGGADDATKNGQILCAGQCHKEKTRAENKARAKKRREAKEKKKKKQN
ncbi:MAG: HNH endonuclease, partial [Algicola sp.]|nr:HNH endonuclease [Algicola sp.]